MNLLLVTLAIGILLLGIVNASDEAVFTLTDSTFDDFIKSKQYVLAEFYAPWCGHCKSLAPHYEKAAQALKDEGLDNVALAKIDATVEKALADKYKIGGFPTLKWFVNGEMKEYTGGRTDQTIISWIKKKTGPAAKPITSVAELESFKSSADVVVVGLFEKEADAASFIQSASNSESVQYGIVVGSSNVEAVKAAAGCASGTPYIVLFKKFDDPQAIFSGDASDSKAIDSFVAGNSLPIITPFSQETAQKIFGGSIKQHVLLFVDSSDKEKKDKTVETAKPVAKEYIGQYLFVTIDKADSRVVEYFGIKDYPTARIVSLGEKGMRKFKLISDEITEKSLRESISGHKDGNLPLELKSEEIPASQAEDVFVLVGKQFNEIVKKDGHKNVLLEVYAPWCGHCKKLAPIYDELAKKYKHFDNLIVAKMDGTLNEVEDFQVGGFPTIKFFPAGSNEAVDYKGGRELADLSKFLEENIPGLASA